MTARARAGRRVSTCATRGRGRATPSSTACTPLAAASTVRGCDGARHRRGLRRLSRDGRGTRAMPASSCAASPTTRLAGVVNVSEIVRGAFQSAFLGYYAFTPHARKGYCARRSMLLVYATRSTSSTCTGSQANVQPENVASVQLIRSLGFEPRSRSPRYLFLDGDWRDHVGYVRLREPGPPAVGSHRGGHAARRRRGRSPRLARDPDRARPADVRGSGRRTTSRDACST